jgi:hypothetical protein
LSEKRGVAELLGAACISFLQSFLRAQSGSRKSTFRGRTQIDPKGFRHRARRNDGLHRRPAVASKLSLTPDFLNARKIWKIFILPFRRCGRQVSDRLGTAIRLSRRSDR